MSLLRWNSRAEAPAAAPRPILVPLVVACAMFMQNLDSTVIATALPTIARSLGESPLTLNVAITCYLLSLAVFIPISGWTADRFGARLFQRSNDNGNLPGVSYRLFREPA